MSLLRGLGQVRRGDVKGRDVMSWEGNYSDCAFGSHRPGQTQSIPGRHEQVNRAGSQLGPTCRAVNRELGQEKILHKTQDYTEQKKDCLKKLFSFDSLWQL